LGQACGRARLQHEIHATPRCVWKTEGRCVSRGNPTQRD
jgi:hypothetical protein